MDDIKSHGYFLAPSRFVGTEEELEDNVPFEEKFVNLKNDLDNQFKNGRDLEGKIAKVLSLVSSND